LQEANIDGYRFDVAHMVPVDFWDDVRPALQEVKEVFLLAEADQPFLHKKAMDMSYDWKFHHIMNEVAAGKQTVIDMKKHFAYVDTAYPPNSILMQFTSNHDENSWNGTVYDRLGEGVETFAALTFTVPGMPLIYNGQEACMNKMLEFFVRDPIEWKDCELFDFYKKLIDLRTNTPALWSASSGGDMNIFSTNEDEKVFAFSREKNDSKVIAVFNFSGEPLSVNLPEGIEDENFTDYFTGEEKENISGMELNLEPWDYKIFVNRVIFAK
jgi:glycosidase